MAGYPAAPLVQTGLYAEPDGDMGERYASRNWRFFDKYLVLGTGLDGPYVLISVQSQRYNCSANEFGTIYALCVFLGSAYEC